LLQQQQEQQEQPLPSPLSSLYIAGTTCKTKCHTWVENVAYTEPSDIQSVGWNCLLTIPK